MFRLNDEFVEAYKEKTVDFGFNGLGEMVYLRTYSRLKKDGSKEKWYETVKRVVEWVFDTQKKHVESNNLGWDEMKAQKTAQEMYDRMFVMKFLPPGRGLWIAGTEALKDKPIAAALNNCFDGDEKFATKKHGVVKFKDAYGEFVDVLTLNGDYRRASVNCHGKQDLFKITFKPFGLRSNYSFNKIATKDHRWILSDGSITTNLKPGDVIKTNLRNIDINSQEYIEGFTHGLIFGDGTRHTYYTKRQFIRLCGSKNKHADIIRKSEYYHSETKCGNDKILTFINSRNYKNIPGVESEKYNRGFIDGWISADAWKKPSGSICLDTQDSNAANWIVENSGILGYFITGYSVDNRPTNYGKRSNPLHRISMTTKAVKYKVSSIEFEKTDNVYCVSEPTTRTFTLAGGIPTGNCAFVSTSDMENNPTRPFEFLMDMSMLGVGVGFDTEGANKIVIQSPNLSKEKFTIPDSREGWVAALRLVLEAFFYSNCNLPEFDYSQVRKQGEPIHGFGGVASGPEPLKHLLISIIDQFSHRADEPVTETDIVDIMNKIGCCVIAGNVRRTAEIAIGRADSNEFLNLKNYKYNAEKGIYEGTSAHRAGYGWTSNNSVFATLGMDYSKIAEMIANNGEPGIVWLDNIKKYSRMCDEPDNKDHKAVGTNPCVEQSLESFELCCLVETFPTRCASKEDYLRTLKFAYLYAKTVTLCNTHWPETNRVMLRNRRIGTSMSGIAQIYDKKGISYLKDLCIRGYKTIKNWDEVYSDWLCIPKSIKTTSVKPSGSVSLLAGCTPGIHFPESKFYIRRMRLSKHSDMVQPLKNAGYNVVDAIEDPEGTCVVEIPVKVDGVRELKSVSMWEQLSIASFMQEYWADNQVSATITFDPKTEGKQIEKALNFFQYKLKGISFLPRLEYGAFHQMPYEAIQEKDYTDKFSKLKPIQWNKMSDDSVGERFCNNDTCTIG